MATEEPIPDYLYAFTDEASLWAKIQLRFDALSTVFDMRLETEVEAIGHKEKAVWVDDAPRWDGQRAWLLLPYINALDQNRLQEQIDIGRSLVSSIHERLRNRELSPAFLHDWGRFCAAAGLIEFIYFSNTSVGHARSALAGGAARIDEAEAHQRWFAHYFLKRYKRGKREEAEEAVERLINAIIDDRIEMPTGYTVESFESYLKLEDPKAPDYAKLKPAFNALSVKCMETLKAIGSGGIPPIDLEFPNP